MISEISSTHNAFIKCGSNPLFSEQDPRKIVETAVDLMKQLNLSDLKAICTSGQMHDVMLWNSGGDYTESEWPCSKLVTWMDQRCDSEFLASLPV